MCKTFSEELTLGCKNGPAEDLNMTKKKINKATERDDMNLSPAGDPVGGNVAGV